MSEQAEPSRDVRPATQVTVRRAPRYRAFAATGVALGLAVTVVLAFSFDRSGERFSVQALLAYLGIPLALIGGLLGAGAALLAERRRGAVRHS